MGVTVYPNITDTEVLTETKKEIIHTNSLIEEQNKLIQINNQYQSIITDEEVTEIDI